MAAIRTRAPARAFLLLTLVMTAGCQPTASPPGPAKPHRIASLNLATDEILNDLVPLERVILVSAFADSEVSNVAGHYPRSVPRLVALDVEKLLLLEPDLVLVAPYNNADAVELIRGRCPVFRYDAVKGMDSIVAGILALGERVGEPEKAKAIVDRFQGRRQELARRLEKTTARPRVLYWSGGFTAGSDTTIHDLIVEGGGRNVADALGLKGNVEITPESVIFADPDYILLGGSDGDESSSIFNHPILRKLSAVKAKRVAHVEGRYLSTVSHHLIEGTERLARVLHPEAFADGKQP